MAAGVARRGAVVRELCCSRNDGLGSRSQRAGGATMRVAAKLASILAVVAMALAGCEKAPVPEQTPPGADAPVSSPATVPTSQPSSYSAPVDADTPYQDRHGDEECTQDCSGHEAGYKWAEANSIDDEDDCTGNSQSFIEGCQAYVRDQGGSGGEG